MNSIDTFDGMTHDDDTRKSHEGGDNEMGQPALKDRVTVKAENYWVTTGQAKRMLGVSSVNTVKRWVAEGKLEAQKVGPNNWMRISVDSISRLLRSGDENVQAFRRLKQRIDAMSDLDFDLTEEDLQEMSDRRMGKLPWEN
jgi:hypothetical protein